MVSTKKLNHQEMKNNEASKFKDVDYVLNFLDNQQIQNFDFSILNHMGENVYDDNPRQIKNLKN